MCLFYRETEYLVPSIKVSTVQTRYVDKERFEKKKKRSIEI